MSEAKDTTEGDKPKKKTLSLGGGKKSTLSLKGGVPARAPSSSSGPEVMRTSRISRRRGSIKDDAKKTQENSTEQKARLDALKRAQEAGGEKRTTLPKRRTTLETVKREARDAEAEKRANEATDPSKKKKEALVCVSPGRE